jgi:hypothetical protein
MPAIFTRLHLGSETPCGQRVILTTNVLLLCGAVALLMLLGHLYGTRYNVAWGDETLFTDIAETFSSRGTLGAPSYEGNGLRMAEKTYFMPPLYPLTLAAWFRFVPPTLQSARLLSNVLAVGCLVIVFLLAQSFRKNNLLAGLIVLGLAIDVQFAGMFNWARPDILALTLSLLAVLAYFRSIIPEKGISLTGLSFAWATACAGMLTHPVGGMIGFMTIPAHLVFAAPRELRKPLPWVILLCIPLIAVGLWAAYIVQDIPVFQAQFLDWQSARKSSRFNGPMAYLHVIIQTCLNYGIKGSGLLACVSTGVVLLVGLKSFAEDTPKRPSLLVLILILVSGLALNLGREMAYPPLLLPAFYLGLFLCAEPLCAFVAHPKVADIKGGVLYLNYSLVIAVVLFLVIAKSSLATWGLVQEVRNSERADAYDPATLATYIIGFTDAESSLAISVFPDCYDILAHSGHFKRVRKLSWHNLSQRELLDYVCSNDYLVITDSALEPRYPGRLTDFTAPAQGSSAYMQIAEEFYDLKKVIKLPGGGVSRLYQRDHDKGLKGDDRAGLVEGLQR